MKNLLNWKTLYLSIHVIVGIAVMFSKEVELTRINLVLLGFYFILVGVNDYRRNK